MALVSGWAAPGFERVWDTFEANFARGTENGAAFAAYVDGAPVVTIWGGLADTATQRPWSRDTLQVIFSGTKGLVAVCLLMLIERDALDLNEPVARYWPEFSAEGKEDIRVSQLVSHQAGLPAFDRHLDLEDVLDDRRAAQILAEQRPIVRPGSMVCYHPFTFGWLCGELIRRIDGRSVGRFFAEEVAIPLGLEVWIGLPDGKQGDVATLELASGWDARARIPAPEFASLAEAVSKNPPLLAELEFPWNRPEFQRAEIPGAGAIGRVDSIARLYACLACGGSLNGVRILAPETVAIGRNMLCHGYEPLLEMPISLGCGFQLQTEDLPFGPAADGFGHNGAGGSMHGAWPAARVGYSYAMNLLRNEEKVDARGRALLEALHESITGARIQRSQRPDTAGST